MTRPSEFRLNTTPRRPALVGLDATFAVVRSARRHPLGWWPGDRGAGVGRGSREDARYRLPGAEDHDQAGAAA